MDAFCYKASGDCRVKKKDKKGWHVSTKDPKRVNACVCQHTFAYQLVYIRAVNISVQIDGPMRGSPVFFKLNQFCLNWCERKQNDFPITALNEQTKKRLLINAKLIHFARAWPRHLYARWSAREIQSFPAFFSEKKKKHLTTERGFLSFPLKGRKRTSSAAIFIV